MKIAYGFSNCSDQKYKQIVGEKKAFVMVTDQKYHGLLIRGIIQNGVEVKCYSGLPINREISNKLIIREQDDIENGIQYHYYTTVNLPIVRQIMIFLSGFFNILFSKNAYKCIICDYMSIMNTFGMGLAAKIKKIPIIEIVMDLPGLMKTTGETVRGVYKIIANLSSGFVLLTQQMNEVVNKQNKPYIVLEGHVDCALQKVPMNERWEYTTGKRVVIYAGGIHKVFGIENLVHGFIKASIANSELRIFGDGDYREELESICKDHANIKYMGVIDNKEIVWQEQRAALLVNPRPSAPIYTKYSFPSKNMEYMVSGTPVLTTKLPGMPDEYKQYVYTIDKETTEGISDALQKVFHYTFEERCVNAEKAREFVLEHKNNNTQAAKILHLLSRLSV